MGIQALGMGLGTLIAEMGQKQRSSPRMIFVVIRPRSNTR
jgi:hypothetical protein